jgi:hypothetical protein
MNPWIGRAVILVAAVVMIALRARAWPLVCGVFTGRTSIWE